MKNKNKLMNWARSCHFDGLIVVKEVKGKKWMNILSFLESKYDFDIDKMTLVDSWIKIKEVINNLTDDEAYYILAKRNSER